MIDSNLSHHFTEKFNLIGKIFIKLNISPNTITFLAFIIGIGSAIALSFSNTILALILLWISGLFDVLDGTVARAMGKSSKLGAYLDLIFDRIVESGIIIGFYFFLPEHTIAYLIFFAGAMFNFTTFMLAGNLFDNKSKKSMHYDSGLIERTETFITFALMMIFPAFSFIILMIFNLLMITTGLSRLFRVIKHERLG